jgi:hypothetical protein
MWISFFSSGETIRPLASGLELNISATQNDKLLNKTKWGSSKLPVELQTWWHFIL